MRGDQPTDNPTAGQADHHRFGEEDESLGVGGEWMGELRNRQRNIGHHYGMLVFFSRVWSHSS